MAGPGVIVGWGVVVGFGGFGVDRLKAEAGIVEIEQILLVGIPEIRGEILEEVPEEVRLRRGEFGQFDVDADVAAGVDRASMSTTACWTAVASTVFLPAAMAAKRASRAMFWARRGMPRL
jgi:hypothetical protein